MKRESRRISISLGEIEKKKKRCSQGPRIEDKGKKMKQEIRRKKTPLEEEKKEREMSLKE